MFNINIPSFGDLSIEHMVFDFNGTIAIDGKLLDGVRESIEKYQDILDFHVITADTFGYVKKELAGLDLNLIIIPNGSQDTSKLNYLKKLGPEKTICVGNGANDRLMLKEACIGIAILLDEGLNSPTLFAADIVVKDIKDIFNYLEKPERLIATLRN